MEGDAMDESTPDDRLEAFEKRQQLFISQHLEYHSKATNSKIDGVRDELKDDIAGVRKASETAHESILERLRRIESKLE